LSGDVPAKREIGEMCNAGEGEATRNQEGGSAGQRLTQGEQQETAGEQSAKEAEPRRADAEKRAQDQNGDGLERDQREDHVDEPRLDHEIDHAFSARRRLGQ
jgi:hypothetical protein